MDAARLDRRVVGAGISAGGPRLQTDHLMILQATATALDPDAAQTLATATHSLVRAGQHDTNAVRDACTPIQAWIAAHEGWSTRKFSAAQVNDVRRVLIRYAADGRMGDFAAAEQTFLSIETLSLYLGDEDRHRSSLDQLFNTVEDDAKFDPKQFAAAAERMAGAM
jgi:hypothetical protein